MQKAEGKQREIDYNKHNHIEYREEELFPLIITRSMGDDCDDGEEADNNQRLEKKNRMLRRRFII